MKKTILFMLMISMSLALLSCIDNPVKPSEEELSANVEEAVLN